MKDHRSSYERLPDWNLANDSCLLCKLMAYTVQTDGLKISESTQPTVYRTPNQFHKTYQPFSMIKVFWGDATGADRLPPAPFNVSSEAKGLDFVRLLKEDEIDFSIILGWLRFCQDRHACSRQDPNLSINHEGLRLIDCETRQVVPALNHQYITLSYVWGPQARTSTVNNYIDVLPHNLPDTIEDSITVVKKLGFRYLWVDRYCIDRRDKNAFQAQPNTMGTIYRNSLLAIIAVAGDSDSYGLPGVGRPRSRSSQLSAKAGNVI
jgi:hypothetical protein